MTQSTSSKRTSLGRTGWLALAAMGCGTPMDAADAPQEVAETRKALSGCRSADARATDAWCQAVNCDAVYVDAGFCTNANAAPAPVDPDDRATESDSPEPDTPAPPAEGTESQGHCFVVTEWWPGACGAAANENTCERGWGTYETEQACCDAHGFTCDASEHDTRDAPSEAPTEELSEGDPSSAPSEPQPVTPESDRGASAKCEASFEELLTREQFEEMFPRRGVAPCRGSVFTYDGLVAAARSFPAFGGTGDCETARREIAAFLGQTAHETSGAWATAPGGAEAWGLCFAEEVGCESGRCTQYCDAGNRSYPCADPKRYHGRGAMQLSWNYNYGAAGAALGEDLLKQPERVSTAPYLAFATALWFWMTPQAPKPSAHDVVTGAFKPTARDAALGRTPGFGLTTNIINGGIECGKPTHPKVERRVLYYKHFCALLGVQPDANLYCDQMAHY